MFPLSCLGAHSHDRLLLCPLAGVVVPDSAGHHMRNRLLEGMAVRGPPSDMMFTALQRCRGHDRLCALVRILAHAPRRDEAAFARKVLDSAGGEALATVATVIAVAVTAVEVRTGVGVAIDIDSSRFLEVTRTAFCSVCARCLLCHGPLSV